MGKRELISLEQGRFQPVFRREEEVMLEITIPLVADMPEFRVGWSLKGLRGSGWIAMSTGRAEWHRDRLAPAADHVRNLLESAWDLVSDRRELRPGS